MAKSWTMKPNRGVIITTRKGALRGLTAAAEFVLGEAQAKAPIEEGTLERSGTVVVDEENLRATISFDTPYAVRQHEELNYQHDAGREAKFLENAMNANAAQVGQIIRDEIRKELH